MNSYQFSLLAIVLISTKSIILAENPPSSAFPDQSASSVQKFYNNGGKNNPYERSSYPDTGNGALFYNPFPSQSPQSVQQFYDNPNKTIPSQPLESTPIDQTIIQQGQGQIQQPGQQLPQGQPIQPQANQVLQPNPNQAPQQTPASAYQNERLPPNYQVQKVAPVPILDVKHEQQEMKKENNAW